jgi:hypothetical protein
MNAAAARSEMPRPTSPVAPPAAVPAASATKRAVPVESLSVWDERARKMGFPPSAR